MPAPSNNVAVQSQTVCLLECIFRTVVRLVQQPLPAHVSRQGGAEGAHVAQVAQGRDKQPQPFAGGSGDPSIWAIIARIVLLQETENPEGRSGGAEGQSGGAEGRSTHLARMAPLLASIAIVAPTLVLDPTVVCAGRSAR